MRTLGLACLLFLLPSCGKVFINGSWTGGNMQTASGMVSIVQLTIVSDDTQVTIVTLANNSINTSETFCGDHARTTLFESVQRAGLGELRTKGFTASEFQSLKP